MNNFSPELAEICDRLLDENVIRFGEFRLKVHETKPDLPLSPIYLNLRTEGVIKNGEAGTLTTDTLGLIVRAMYSKLMESGATKFDAYCGIPNAGVPFADVIEASPEMNLGIRIDLIKEDKGDGKRQIVGIKGEVPLEKGANILVIDDLISQGATKMEAIGVLRQAGFKTDSLAVFVDRKQGGAEDLRANGVRVYAFTTIREIVSYYLQNNRINQATFDTVSQYFGWS